MIFTYLYWIPRVLVKWIRYRYLKYRVKNVDVRTVRAFGAIGRALGNQVRRKPDNTHGPMRPSVRQLPMLPRQTELLTGDYLDASVPPSQ